MTPTANRSAIASELSRVLKEISWKRWYQAILIKDAEERALTDFDRLKALGFLTTSGPAMNVVPVRHDCLEHWLASLRSHYRYAWRKSMTKLDNAGLSCRHYVGQEITQVYTRSMHRMYSELEKRQNLCFERMPFRFFRHLVEACKDNVHLTTISAANRCLAFSWSVEFDGVYQNLLCGFDSELNRRFDLYFNLAIRDMGYGFHIGSEEVWLGQTTNEFKTRLGAQVVPRHLHIRCIPPVTAALRSFQSHLFPASEKFAPRNLYRSGPKIAFPRLKAPAAA